MMYAARHRKAAIRWDVSRPMTWVEILGAAALAGVMTAVFTLMVFCA